MTYKYFIMRTEFELCMLQAKQRYVCLYAFIYEICTFFIKLNESSFFDVNIHKVKCDIKLLIEIFVV